MGKLSFFVFFLIIALAYADFNTEVDLSNWDKSKTQISQDGRTIQVSLNQAGGGGFTSKNEYLYGVYSMKIKVVSGYSAGTVTTYYIRSAGNQFDEIDFELLGNVTGEPYTLHTNIWTRGVGDKEQQFRLWFDPRDDFHTYTALWTRQQIVWLVDGTPIRVFKNNEASGVPFPTSQPMRIYGTLWNGDEWATRRGQVKVDWSKAPFTAYFEDFQAQDEAAADRLQAQIFGSDGHAKLQKVQSQNLISDYCTDGHHSPSAQECSV